jgi:type I restriction-modification system DNA methylase subunit
LDLEKLQLKHFYILNGSRTKQKEQQLWNIANTLRGKMDADDFRDYILGFIFYKYLSTKMDLYANTILKPDGLTFQQIEGQPEEGTIDARDQTTRYRQI